MTPCVLGILVGGQSRRMGGFPKGLLRHPGAATHTLVDHWVAIAAKIALPAVLVGNPLAYSVFDLPALPDRPSGVGPIGGLSALLAYCEEQGRLAIAVACDMPFASCDLLCRLCNDEPNASVLAPRHPRTRLWEPLFARYDPDRVRPLLNLQLGSNDHSLQKLVNTTPGVELPMTQDEWHQLKDWDTPSDRMGNAE
jgi:molybdopterin-guanine dinucleotide biosynthesis protein A